MVAYYTLMIRFLPLLAALTALTLQPSPAGDSWSRVAALYRERLQQTDIAGSSLMFVKNGEVVHKAFEGYQDLAAKRAALKVARVNLDYTRIVAPTDGIVGERKVRPGQLVSAGTQVLSVVGNDTWVVANYKEVQLAKVKIGDRASVRVDGVPDVVFAGRVETISPGSGSTFSLLPPDNATGNFTKIAQRIPVKIAFAETKIDPRLRAGMSTTVSIRTVP